MNTDKEPCSEIFTQMQSCDETMCGNTYTLSRVQIGLFENPYVI